MQETQLVVYGGCKVAASLTHVLSAFATSLEVQKCSDAHDLTALVSGFALSNEFRSSARVLRVVPPMDHLSAEKAFALHSLLRRPIKLGQREFAWSGGLVFIGGSREESEAIKLSPPFNMITGHMIVPRPFRLFDILRSISEVEPLHINRWNQILHNLGLAAFWEGIDEVERSIQEQTLQKSADLLSELLTQVLEDDVLERLMAHNDVRSELTRISAAITETPHPSAELMYNLVSRIRRVMHRYRLT